MRALSIRQPWAWLICKGIKDVENRTWHIHMPPLLSGYPSTPKRIYVHASKTLDTTLASWDFIRIRVNPEIWQMMCSTEFVYDELAVGAIIGEVDIVGCCGTWGRLYPPWHEDCMYGLLLANPVLYAKPIPCKGKPGFFEPAIAP